MKQITISVGTQSNTYNMPESWDEVTPTAYIYAANHPVEEDKTPSDVLAILCGVPYDVSFFVTPIYWRKVMEEHMPWVKNLSLISQWMVPCLRLSDGRETFPPAPDFSNVSWEEFIFADELAQRQRWHALASIFYRPLNPNATEDEEQRIPFSRQGASARMPLFQKVDIATINAIGINYLVLRKRMTKRYPHLFAKASGDGGRSSGWVEVSRAILGENVWEEKNLLTTSVNQVLYRLDAQVKEANQRKRNERRK